MFSSYFKDLKEKEMKARMVQLLSLVLLMTSFMCLSVSQVRVSGDTTYIAGGTYSGAENIGLMETTINNDTLATGARTNSNMVYALYEGQVYYQTAAIYVNNPTGTFTLVGVPDPAHATKTEKPMIIIQPTSGISIGIGANNGAVNMVYGSIKVQNIYYQTQQTDGHINNELFFCGTANKLPQSLTIDNCLFEFCNIDLFDCSNESGAIGGWPYGAKFFITNNYFRNLFNPGQWWGSRVFQCKHPIDTVWIENNTVTGGGLTFLQQNQLTDFMFVNHNTIVNNHKNWLLSPYHRIFFLTNNVFINQNWVGEDTNVVLSGQDPDHSLTSTINIDSNSATNGLVVQAKYLNADSTINQSILGLHKLQIFVSNNVNYYDPQLISGYYHSSTYILADTGNPAAPFNAIPSYIDWWWNIPGVWPVRNMPGEWMNRRTQALFAAYSPFNGGGFVEENTTTANPGTPTPGLADASVVTMMAQWNQNKYQDTRFLVAPAITSSRYIFGDYDPTTLPGIVGDSKTEGIQNTDLIGAGDQLGIKKFTDFTENFLSTVMSNYDGFPVGSLIWSDALNASFNARTPAQRFVQAYQHYMALIPHIIAVNTGLLTPGTFSLEQNYPNPFNPRTNINFTLAKTSNVKLSVYNVLGQKVMTLIDSRMSVGEQSIVFDASKLTTGVYFYRLDAGSFSSVKKMLLLK
jgi:hypothetical protein